MDRKRLEFITDRIRRNRSVPDVAELALELAEELNRWIPPPKAPVVEVPASAVVVDTVEVDFTEVPAAELPAVDSKRLAAPKAKS